MALSITHTIYVCVYIYAYIYSCHIYAYIYILVTSQLYANLGTCSFLKGTSYSLQYISVGGIIQTVIVYFPLGKFHP